MTKKGGMGDNGGISAPRGEDEQDDDDDDCDNDDTSAG
jgi:hypothetical protein